MAKKRSQNQNKKERRRKAIKTCVHTPFFSKKGDLFPIDKRWKKRDIYSGGEAAGRDSKNKREGKKIE